MRFLKSLVFALALGAAPAAPIPALADSTAQQTVGGYWVTAPQLNCPSGVCFFANTPSQPLCPGQYGLAPTTAVGLTLPTGIAASGSCVATSVSASYATVCAYTATVYYTTDGYTTPTSANMQLASGSCVALISPNVIKNFKAFSSSGTLNIEYFQ